MKFLLSVQIVQKEREEKLSEILKGRLNQYVQGNKDDFVSHAEAEVARLSNAGTMILYKLCLDQDNGKKRLKCQ